MTELRLRNISKELAAKIKKIEVAFKTPEATTAVSRLIDQYFEDQKSIAELQKRNSQLHAAINKYYSKEDTMLRLVQDTTRQANETARLMAIRAKSFKGMEKHFGKKKGGRS